MIRTRPVKGNKRKVREATEVWMNTPITFPPLLVEDVSEEPIIIEAEVEGYLVRRVYVDEGASVEVMFEHCFENLNPAIKARLRETQTDLVGFAGEITKPLGKIDFEVCFRSEGLCRRTTMKFTVIRAPSPYNSQIGINLEAYVDDMVIKSNDENILLANIAKMFDNVRRINMKLNPKKCSFGVEEGKFLGYMVTSEGIRANPKKTRALENLQSPRTLKEMQSFSEKLAALNQFLAKSAERSLPFFNTLKNITKENKDEYKWTAKAEEAFQQMKKLILDLPSLTLSLLKETLYAYLAISKETGQVLADFISKTPNGEPMESYLRTPEVVPERNDTETWTLFTDGATNNEAEYEALLAGLRIAKRMKVQNLEANVDSKLVASQINGSYVPSSDIMKADVLSKLASVAFNILTKEILVEVLNERSIEMKEITIFVEAVGDYCTSPIIQGLEKGVWPKDKNKVCCLQVKIHQYVMEDGVLFNKSYLVPMLRCVGLLHLRNTHGSLRNAFGAAVGGSKGDEARILLAHYAQRSKGGNSEMFSLPRIIVTDNSMQFVNDPFKSWCAKLDIQQMNIVVAHPQANGLVERANKSLMEGIKTSRYTIRDWHVYSPDHDDQGGIKRRRDSSEPVPTIRKKGAGSYPRSQERGKQSGGLREAEAQMGRDI
ncbi:reverse transcriptase domain-containing protein [Tanacetum coccineum]